MYKRQNETLFVQADEKLKPSFLRKPHTHPGEVIPPESGDFVSRENLYNYVAKVMRLSLIHIWLMVKAMTRENTSITGQRTAMRMII